MMQFIKIENYLWSVHKHPILESSQFWQQKFYGTFVARLEMIVSGLIKGAKYYSARRIKIV
jgi:hypothetical protein